jgi:hypothetical protein
MNAAEISAKLTKAQREQIIRVAGDDWFPVQWEGWCGLFSSLQLRGLAYPREPGLQTLSPLGLAVRAILQAKEPTDDQ